MRPVEKFTEEIERLELLHLGTLYAYDQAAARATETVDAGYLEDSDEVKRILKPGYRHEVVANNQPELRRKLKKDFPRHLREALFVRVISALEVFFVDLARWIYMRRRDLFAHGRDLAIPGGLLGSFASIDELTSFLINRECRDLHGMSLKQVRSYFRRNFEIDFGLFPGGLTPVAEMHDRRHLLVHRLGRVDAKYRHDYGSNEPRVQVDREYLIAAFERSRDFADFLVGAAHEVAAATPSESGRDDTRITIQLGVRIFDDEGELLVDPKLEFEVDEHVYQLADILFSRHVDDEGTVWLGLQGRRRVVKEYTRRLRRIHRAKGRKPLLIKGSRQLHRYYVERKPLDEDLLERIAASLPDGDWPVGLHRRIAETFGLSNGLAYEALATLRAREGFGGSTGDGEEPHGA